MPKNLYTYLYLSMGVFRLQMYFWSRTHNFYLTMALPTVYLVKLVDNKYIKIINFLNDFIKNL